VEKAVSRQFKAAGKSRPAIAVRASTEIRLARATAAH